MVDRRIAALNRTTHAQVTKTQAYLPETWYHIPIKQSAIEMSVDMPPSYTLRPLKWPLTAGGPDWGITSRSTQSWLTDATGRTRVISSFQTWPVIATTDGHFGVDHDKARSVYQRACLIIVSRQPRSLRQMPPDSQIAFLSWRMLLQSTPHMHLTRVLMMRLSDPYVRVHRTCSLCFHQM